MNEAKLTQTILELRAENKKLREELEGTARNIIGRLDDLSSRLLSISEAMEKRGERLTFPT